MYDLTKKISNNKSNNYLIQYLPKKSFSHKSIKTSIKIFSTKGRELVV